MWSHRADRYGLFTAALPAYTAYTSGANYAADAIVLDHLPGDDYRLFKAKAAITGAAAYLNPVLWDEVEPAQRVDRRFLQAWTDDDFTIGARVPSGDYAGLYVGEIIVPGGKYPSVEGGFRPTFLSGGTGQDATREITGYLTAHGNRVSIATSGGAFYGDGVASGAAEATYSYPVPITQRFASGRVVPVAADNRVRTTAMRIWRRVA